MCMLAECSFRNSEGTISQPLFLQDSLLPVSARLSSPWCLDSDFSFRSCPQLSYLPYSVGLLCSSLSSSLLCCSWKLSWQSLGGWGSSPHEFCLSWCHRLWWLLWNALRQKPDMFCPVYGSLQPRRASYPSQWRLKYSRESKHLIPGKWDYSWFPKRE